MACGEMMNGMKTGKMNCRAMSGVVDGLVQRGGGRG